MGMIGVDKIGEIRRAYFEQDRSIKEIVRTLLVSRATVRKVIRGHKTEFKYARGVQPTPKLGDWVEALTEILGTEANLPKRERRSVAAHLTVVDLRLVAAGSLILPLLGVLVRLGRNSLWRSNRVFSLLLGECGVEARRGE